MQQYASTIIYICIFTIILELILPDNKLKNYVGVLVSLVIILTLLSPIVNLIKKDEVVAVISDAIESIQSKVETKEYDFSNLQNRLVFSSVKEEIENDIYLKCKEKFESKFGINKVKIILNEEYVVEDIDIYIDNLPEVAMAAEIIDYVAYKYSIEASVINIIKEEN